MQEIKHLLVIRLSAMGDVAMLVPVLLKINSDYPNLKITVLTKAFFAPIFKDIPNVEILPAEIYGKHKGISGLNRLAMELREKNIDAVADLHNVLRSNVLKFHFKLSGIPLKQIDKGRAEKKALTRSKNKIFKPLKSTHQRYADVFAALGFPVDLSQIPFLPKRELSKSVFNFTGVKSNKWIGIAPFAQHKSKVYPEDLMKKVINGLNSDDIQIFLFGGGEAEKNILVEWENEFENVKNLTGKFSFEEEIQLISNLDIMLSMDSGNAHLAANFGIPVITLWGLTHPFAGFSAFGQPESNSLLPDLEKYPKIPTSVYGKEIPNGYENAMRDIPPEKVVEKIWELLKVERTL